MVQPKLRSFLSEQNGAQIETKLDFNLKLQYIEIGLHLSGDRLGLSYLETFSPSVTEYLTT
jgi:hypothetical protein